MESFAEASAILQGSAWRADHVNPRRTAPDAEKHKHRSADENDDFIEKDTSTGNGTRHRRPYRSEYEDIDGKDGGLNRAGDERGWNASQQPRDAHGRFITEKDKNHASSSAKTNADRNADSTGI
jgi:hypothetical protein